KSKKETNDFRLYKQELVSKNAILVEVSNPSLSKFNSNSLLLLEPYEDSFKGELVLLTTDSKIIIGHINLFNDKELQLKPIDSESTVTIKKDLIMIWKIVEVIQLIS
ncbi:XRE family transcriptional regulator, partial [Listeria monocytogenes]|nr:XRE family transcriptional regulator [Listeria monocytogenes]